MYTRRNAKAQKMQSYVTLTRRAHSSKKTDVQDPGPHISKKMTHLSVTKPKVVARGDRVGPAHPQGRSNLD